MKKMTDEELLVFCDNMDDMLREVDYLNNFVYADDETGKYELFCQSMLDHMDESNYININIYKLLNGYEYVDKKGNKKIFNSNRKEDLIELIRFVLNDKIEKMLNNINTDVTDKESFISYLVIAQDYDEIIEIIKLNMIENEELNESIYKYLDEIISEYYCKKSVEKIYKGIDKLISKFNGLILRDSENADVYIHNINVLLNIAKEKNLKFTLNPSKIDKFIDKDNTEFLVMYNLLTEEEKKQMIKSIEDNISKHHYTIDEVTNHVIGNPYKPFKKEDAETLYKFVNKNKRFINDNGIPYTREQVIGYVNYLIRNEYEYEDLLPKFSTRCTKTDEELADISAQYESLSEEDKIVVKKLSALVNKRKTQKNKW